MNHKVTPSPRSPQFLPPDVTQDTNFLSDTKDGNKNIVDKGEFPLLSSKTEFEQGSQ